MAVKYGMRQAIEEIYGEEELLLMDGCDDAIIGVAKQFGKPLAVVYDRGKLIELAMSGGASYEEADDHVSINQEGGYHGPHTPIILDDMKHMLD